MPVLLETTDTSAGFISTVKEVVGEGFIEKESGDADTVGELEEVVEKTP
jgi:hypothetical protein